MPAKRIVSRMVLLALLVALVIPFAQSASAHGPGHGHGHGPTPPTPPAAHLRIGVFAQSIPAMAAVSEGFYADYNLTVEYLQVSSSTQQFEYLRDGLYDIVMTSPDNVANYRLNSSNALGATIDQIAFLGLDNAQKLALVTQPGISSPSELAGKVIAVDSPSSGFAYVIYEILAQYGLQRDVDYTVLPVGGVYQRYVGLLNGDFDATLLSNGFETRADIPFGDGNRWIEVAPTGGARSNCVVDKVTDAVEIVTLYFAALRDKVGLDRETISLPEDVRTIADLAAWLETNRPSLRGHVAKARFAVGEEFVEGARALRRGDVVALIPPVSGG